MRRVALRSRGGGREKRDDMNPVRRLPACGRSILAAIVLLFVTPGTGVEVAWASEPQAFEADVCVYGGTSGGVVAAVQTTRMGKTVVLVEPGRHLGGMSSGGLSLLRHGQQGHRRRTGPASIAGSVRKQRRGTRKRPGSSRAVAERVFDEMAREANVPVYFDRKIASVRRTASRPGCARHRGGRHVPVRLHRRHL